MEALIGQLFNGINPVVLSWYRDRTGIAQKLQRLDMLVTKIRSVLEVSEKIKIDITAEHLLKFQQIYRDAAAKGAEVLQKFQDHQAVMSNSSSRISNLFEGLISKKDDVGNLNSTLEWLEQLSAEVKDFLRTLKMGKWEVPLEKRRKSEPVFRRDEKKKDVKKEEKKKEEEKEEKPLPYQFSYAYDTPWSSLSLPPMEYYYQHRRSFPLPPMPWYNQHGHGAPSHQFPISLPEDRYILKSRFPDEYLATNTPKVSKRKKGNKSPVPDSGSDEFERSLEDEKKDMEPKADKAPKKEKKLVFKRINDEKETQSSNSNPSDLLSRRKIEIDAVEELAAKIQHAVERAKKMSNEHGSCFNQWIAQLEEAIEEGNSVAEAIKANDDLCTDDRIADEVGVILAAVRSRLESIVENDLDDFKNLVTVSKYWV